MINIDDHNYNCWHGRIPRKAFTSKCKLKKANKTTSSIFISLIFVLIQQHILLEINISYDDEEVEYLSK